MNPARSRHLTLEAVCAEMHVERVAVVAKPFRHGVSRDGLKGGRHLVFGSLEKHVLELVILLLISGELIFITHSHAREFTAGAHVGGIRSDRRELVPLAHVGVRPAVAVSGNEFTDPGFHTGGRRFGVLSSITVGRAFLSLIGLSIGIEESAVFLYDVSLILLSFGLQMGRHALHVRLALHLLAAVARVSCGEIVVSAASTSPAILGELFPSLSLLLGLDRGRSGGLHIFGNAFGAQVSV